MLRNGLIFACMILITSCGADSSPPDNNVSIGGAQDIGQFRQILSEGGLPDHFILDDNGFFSEHYIENPPADCGYMICMQPMVSASRDWVFNLPQTLLQMGINTSAQPKDLPDLPIQMTVIIDRSGSMSGDRMEFVREGLHQLVNGLDEGDRLAVISYADGVTIHNLLDDEIATSKASLHNIIDDIYANGSTNIYDAVDVGLREASIAYDRDYQNRVILLSDGVATSGNTSTSAILTNAESYLTKGMTLTTIGVGSDFNHHLMTRLAEMGSGARYFLEDEEAVTEVFTEELSLSLAPLAWDFNVELRAGENVLFGRSVGSAMWTNNEVVGKLDAPAVFIASRSSVDGEGPRGGGSSIFLELDHLAFVETPVAEIDVTYKRADTEELETQVGDIARPPIDVTNPHFSHPAMEKHYAMYNTYLALERAAFYTSDHFPTRNLDCSLGVLRQADSQLAAWLVERTDTDLQADRDLLGEFITNLEARGAYAEEDLEGKCSATISYEIPEEVVEPVACSGGSDLGWLAGVLIVLFVVAKRQSLRA